MRSKAVTRSQNQLSEREEELLRERLRGPTKARERPVAHLRKLELRVLLSEEEEQRFRELASRQGLKLGPWARMMLRQAGNLT